ncbi:MAG: hypothetical protein RMM06_09930 [Armatimonadota bacterium]|nr:porin family protein [bacterium]MDW8103416.1 hypothetical protein [Armatimonadota bacterium]MDW8291034.1 hypothetical protein [Armatimonadota bacterium]
MRRLGLAFAATVVLAAWTLPAFAQYGEETVGNNFRVRIGAFFPSKSISRDEAETWFGAGVDYALQRGISMGENYSADLGVSLDYYGSGDVYNVPVLLNYWGKLPGGLNYTAGIGVGFSKRPVSGDTKTGFAYAVGIGYDFNVGGGTPLFIEVRYNGLTGTDNEHDGFAVYLGARF